MKVFTEFLKVRGTAAERAAMAEKDIAPNTHVIFTETDTGDDYTWDGDSWNQATVSGATLVKQPTIPSYTTAELDAAITAGALLNGTPLDQNSPIVYNSTKGYRERYDAGTNSFVKAVEGDEAGAVPVSTPGVTSLTTVALAAAVTAGSLGGIPLNGTRTVRAFDTVLGPVIYNHILGAFVLDMFPVGTTGALPVYIESPLDSSLSDSDGMTIGAATVSRQVFPITDQWNLCELYVGAMTASDTLTLEVSRDGGTTYSVIDPISQVTGAQAGLAGIITDALDSRAYRYPIKGVTHLGFTKTGTAASLAIAWKLVI